MNQNLFFELVNTVSGSLGVVAESQKEFAKWVLTAELEEGDRIVIHENWGS